MDEEDRTVRLENELQDARQVIDQLYHCVIEGCEQPVQFVVVVEVIEEGVDLNLWLCAIHTQKLAGTETTKLNLN
jgi:hypothetical protein